MTKSTNESFLASKNKITLVATQKLESKPVTRAKISSNTAALPVDTNSSTAKKGKEHSENACKNNWFSKRFFKAKVINGETVVVCVQCFYFFCCFVLTSCLLS